MLTANFFFGYQVYGSFDAPASSLLLKTTGRYNQSDLPAPVVGSPGRGVRIVVDATDAFGSSAGANVGRYQGLQASFWVQCTTAPAWALPPPVPGAPPPVPTGPPAVGGTGGVAYSTVVSGTWLTAAASRFQDNSAQAAGGGLAFLAQWQPPNFRLAVTLTDSTVLLNRARAGGGGILAGPGVQLSLVRGLVSRNVAGDSGGGVNATSAAWVFFDGPAVAGNVADGNGGGFACLGPQGGPPNSLGLGSAAPSVSLAGAIAQRAVTPAPLLPSVRIRGGATFSGNTAARQGGGAFLGSGCPLDASGGASFSLNRAAQENGGGMFLMAAGTLQDVSFDANTGALRGGKGSCQAAAHACQGDMRRACKRGSRSL